MSPPVRVLRRRHLPEPRVRLCCGFANALIRLSLRHSLEDSMRAAVGLIMFAAVSIVPGVGSAQVSVTSPAAGAASSYRKTVISWNPIAGASSYHLEIDDDPNFGSPA